MKHHLRQFPFYQKARDLWINTQLNQIVKGLHKYEEPFTPSHWTADELLNHALEETVDTVHYLVGLKELTDQKDATIHHLNAKIALLEDELAFYRKDATTSHYGLDKYNQYKEALYTLINNG